MGHPPRQITVIVEVPVTVELPLVVTVPVMVICSEAAALDETVSSPPLVVIDASLVDDVPVKSDDETLTLQVTKAADIGVPLALAPICRVLPGCTLVEDGVTVRLPLIVPAMTSI